ncbi:Putative esterase [Bremerella volcania]|uniref:Esterase n=1 Tax=Bremerella volcania TaxID=2527984 RepID=A0A518CEZ3_9BACT|nr:alpha/beta hydrolase-fold protein [Bremerella volcania]QDU77789.1 Putative esterase [Bremerella volcania]
MTDQPTYGNWRKIDLDGHLCELFEPRQRNEHGYVVIYLHGVHLGKLYHSPAFVEQFEKFGLPVVAPVTQRSWWTDRICEEFDPQRSAQTYLLQNVLPFVEEQYGARTSKVALFGTSMGGQGSLRFAYKFPDTFPIVAAVSPAIDYQNRMRDDPEDNLWQMYNSPEQARQDTTTLHIHPLNWPRNQFFCCCPEDTSWWESSDRLRMKLQSLGVPHTCDLETKGGGHGFNYYSLMAPKVVQFLWDCLEKERRRIV